MLFYFALLLITLGIISLLFTAFSILLRKSPSSQVKVPPPREQKENTDKVSGKAARERKPSLKPAESRSLERILRVSENKKGSQYWMKHLPDQDTLKIVEEREPQPFPEPEEDPVRIDGILFMDRSRQIHVHADRLKNSPLHFFQELKREGKGSLSIQGRNFRIDTAHSSHNYSASDLEQILFLQKGVALVPLNRSLSVPVFITDRPDEIKNFIKRHSRLRR